MRKKLKIAVLVHKGLLPPDDTSKLTKEELEEIKVESNVIGVLKEEGHTIYPVEMFGELEPLRNLINNEKFDIAFNLLEDFVEYPLFDQQVINYLELKKIPYTGCNPRGLFIAKDKALSKKILAYHNINIPKFLVFHYNKKIKIENDFGYPLFVKSLKEEGSIGISKESIVNSEEKLIERIEYLHNNYSTDVIAEEFVEGREIYVGVMGNSKIKVLTPWELILKNDDSDTPIATSKLKWDAKHQKKVGLITKAAELTPSLKRKFEHISKEIYKALKLSGYARIDYRLKNDDEIYLLEANPNPFLARDEDFAESAKYERIDYPTLLHTIIKNGLTYKPFNH
ncbi:MAG: D-alanine--D-alanine ligase family protein [Syntrophothermus sp.]